MKPFKRSTGVLRLALGGMFAVALTACSKDSPTAPTPTTAPLNVRLDSACGVAFPVILSAEVDIDGVDAGALASNGTMSQIVSIGNHIVSAKTYAIINGIRTNIVLREWGPYTVTVGPAGYTVVLYCN